MPSEPDVRLVSAPRSGLPAWCDRFLEAPATGDVFASRLWFDTVLRHALPPAAEPVLAATNAVLLPMLRVDGRLRSLTVDYSLAWRPLPAPGADAVTLHGAGCGLAALLRLGPPVLIEALDPEARGLAPLLAGLRAGRILAARFASFGNWQESFPAGLDWEAYIAARPPALRNTVRRKLARAARAFVPDLVAAPGPALEAGIADYVAIRGQSWKPYEPFPEFDGELMRALATAGALRLGVLRDGTTGRPVAAQYWALDRGGAAGCLRASVLKLAHAEHAKAESPGTVLTAHMIRALIEQDGVRTLDFGRGDDAYKRLWVSRRLQRVGYVLADPLDPRGAAALAWQFGGAMRAWLRRRGAPARDGADAGG
jgi:hypothetical protein